MKHLFQCAKCGTTFGPESANRSKEEVLEGLRLLIASHHKEVCTVEGACSYTECFCLKEANDVLKYVTDALQ